MWAQESGQRPEGGERVELEGGASEQLRRAERERSGLGTNTSADLARMQWRELWIYCRIGFFSVNKRGIHFVRTVVLLRAILSRGVLKSRSSEPSVVYGGANMTGVVELTLRFEMAEISYEKLGERHREALSVF